MCVRESVITHMHFMPSITFDSLSFVAAQFSFETISKFTLRQTLTPTVRLLRVSECASTLHGRILGRGIECLFLRDRDSLVDEFRKD